MSGTVDQPSAFREGFLRINAVPTHVMTFGCWVKEDSLLLKECKMIVLVFPGNPGMIEFYKDFMETIYVLLQKQVPVWGISHAGHVKVPFAVKSPPLYGNEDLYDLGGQVKHKITFIESFIPSEKSVVIIGHSIGCHMALEVMSSIVGSQVLKSILLFPTIEQLALSPQGQMAKPLLNYFQFLAMICLHILSYLSERIQFKIIEWYFQGKKVADCALRASMNIFDPSCAKKWMLMAQDEMYQVKEADINNIARHLDDLIFYYGENDHWCPKSYYEAMKERFPSGNIILCDQGYDHAFVLESSKELGVLVAGWLQAVLQEYWHNDANQEIVK